MPLRTPGFEAMVVGLGAVVLAVSVLLHPGPISIKELLAQILLLVVLVAAVYGGRNTGFIASLLSSAIYVLLLLSQAADISNPDVLQMIAVRFAGYSLVGIVGGEICDRIRASHHRSKTAEGLDPVSRTYNQRFLAYEINAAISETNRYDTVFSLLTIDPGPKGINKPVTALDKDKIELIGEYLRNDIRVVDKVGRTDEGVFVLVLPNTPVEGAKVIAARIENSIQDLFGDTKEKVSITVMSTPAQLDEITNYAKSLGKDDPLSIFRKH